MTVVLLDAQHPGEADQALIVGEDPDDVGAPADLAVEALERVGRSELAPMRGWERVEGQDVWLGVLEHASDLGQPAVEVRDGLRQPIAGFGERVGVKIGRISAASRPCWSRRACPRQSLRKCTVQRCQAQPRTLAIAAFSRAWASEMASWTPTRPRATRPRRNSVQNASVSASPTSIDRISRRPVSWTP